MLNKNEYLYIPQEITQKEGYWDISKEVYLKHGSRKKSPTNRPHNPKKINLKKSETKSEKKVLSKKSDNKIAKTNFQQLNQIIAI